MGQDVPYRTVAADVTAYMKSLRNILLKLLASMMYPRRLPSYIVASVLHNAAETMTYYKIIMKTHFNYGTMLRFRVILIYCSAGIPALYC